MFNSETLTVPMVDSSHWNTYDASVLNLTLAADAGVKVNLMRLGKGVDQLSSDWGMDRSIINNIQATLGAELKPMFYWRLYAPWHETGRSQAIRTMYHFDSIMNDFPSVRSGAPLILDIEEDHADTDLDVGNEAFADWVLEYEEALRAEGMSNIAIYTRANFWDTRLPNIYWGDKTMGVAHWVRNPDGSIADFSSTNAKTWDETAWDIMSDGPKIPTTWSDIAFWQLAPAEIGKELGFCSNAIDINLLRKDVYEEWFGNAA